MVLTETPTEIPVLRPRLPDADALLPCLRRIDDARAYSRGEGSIVAPTPTYVGLRTTIGNHSIVVPLSAIPHDCSIGDYVTVCPSVKLSGYGTVEDDVFIGVGATIVSGSARNPLHIGRGAMNCAGAAVLQPVPTAAKVAGNPATDLRSMFSSRPGARSRRDGKETRDGT